MGRGTYKHKPVVGVLLRATKPFTRLVEKAGMRETAEHTIPKGCKLLTCRLLHVFPWEH